MRSALIAFLFLVLAGLGAWALLHEDVRAPSLTPAEAENIVATAGQEQDSPAEADYQSAIERVAAGPQTKPSESAGRASEKLLTFQLTVVNGATQQPIPFAEVYEIKKDNELRYQRILQRAKSSNWVTADPELLRLHKTDEDGILQLSIPIGDQYRGLFALHGTLFQISWYEIEAGKQERLELWPDQTWTVLCLDEVGQPLKDFPVALRMWQHNRTSPWFPFYDSTDSNGLATLAHIQQTARYAKDADVFKVVPKIPLQEDVGLEVDIQAPPPMPITLQLPPMGSLRVVVLDAAGLPLDGEFNLRMVMDPEPISGRSAKELKMAFHEKSQSNFHAPGSAGRGHFPFVGLGLNFVFQVQHLEEDDFYGTGRGPERSGENVTVQVQKPPRTGFAMRLLDEQKRPVINMPWSMSYRIEKGDWGRSRAASGRTDSNGDTFLDMEIDLLDFLVDATKSEFEIICQSQNPARILRTVANFPVHRNASEQGLGNLILIRENTVDLHCTIVDAQDQPIERAAFFVQERVFKDGGENWDHLTTGITDSKGEFHIFTRRPDGTTRFGLSKKGFLGRMEEGLPEDGARLVLERGLHISGKMEIQDWMKDTSVYFMSRPSNTPEGRWTHVGYLDTKTGEFKLEAMRPATVDLALRTGYVPFHVATIHGVTPWEHESDADSRLAPWTPNPVPQLFGFEVLDAANETISGVTIFFPNQTFFEGMRPRTLRPGNKIVLPVSTTTAKVLAPGFRSKTFEAVAGANAVKMKSGLATRLQLQNPPSLQPGARIGCELIPVLPSSLGHRVVLSTWQELNFTCSDPGSYKVKIVMIPKDEEPWLESSITIVEQAVEVLDQETEQVILLELMEQ